MDDTTSERIASFEKHMSASWEQLARDERAQDKRWNLLQAIAYLASGDRELVKKAATWCPHPNALPHSNAAQAAFVHMSKELDERRASGERCLSIDGGTRALLLGLKDGEITAYVDAKPTYLTGLDFRELTYSNDLIGLAPAPQGDDRYWRSVNVSAEDVVRLRDGQSIDAGRPNTSSAPTGAKRGPKGKWDWIGMMAELVRVADQDGLDSIGTQADVERWAMKWHADKTGSDGPGVSVVREHIAPVFQAIERENQRRRSGK
ncbi:hypothetical protein KZ813_17945 [Sphingomonas sp. RHCKR7]|uniref:hypothetical protein n=1 Tax=Sphingomonas folli TaxID=2862497 RepID=UPI001CA48867|nr:hypothetical protein [Sphingomonas folli]MBW6528728.1 hypothetical protein [Sphingomonas folli]